MSDTVSILYPEGSWRHALSAFSLDSAKDFLREPALWRPNNSPIEAYRLEPYLVEYPGSPLVVLVLSEEWDEERRQHWLERLRDPHTGNIRPRGKIRGLSDAVANRLAIQFRKLVPERCIDRSMGMALMFPSLKMIDEKAALRVFNKYIKRVERWCRKRGAQIAGYRGMERGPDGCTIHFHVWLWVSDPKLLKDVHQKIEDEWPEAAGYKRRESTATDVQAIQSEASLHWFLRYLAKPESKQDISGVHPVAPIRQQNLPIAEPKKEEVDLPQARFLKEEVNRTLGRRNDPSPMRMIFNLPEAEWRRIKIESYSHRRGPTPSEDHANKVRAAELGDDW
ncbi:MAG: hypothetical protein KF858_04865 [Candidatus Sumerlaeia bacterium]|nr:hypothetical protein [Candidatus Sumerlaeia bacterium]